jgi:hypothetical protein
VIALTLVVPTSLAFAISVLVISLSATVRGIIIYSFQLLWTWFTTSTNLDLVWEKLILNGQNLTERSMREIRDIKACANLARHVRAGTRTGEKEAIRRAVETLGEFRAPIRTDTDGIREVLGEKVETNKKENVLYLEEVYNLNNS